MIVHASKRNARLAPGGFDTAPEAEQFTAVVDPVAGKYAAMCLYNYCGLSLEATSAEFARHPEWRSV